MKRLLVILLLIVGVTKAGIIAQDIVHGLTINKDSLTIGDSFTMTYKLTTNNPNSIVELDFSILDSLQSLADEQVYDSLVYYADVDVKTGNAAFVNKILIPNQQEFTNSNGKFNYVKEFDITVWNVGFYQLSLPKVKTIDSLSFVQGLQSPRFGVYIPEGINHVDTTELILPIKEILVEKKRFSDYLWILYSLLGILALCLLGFYLYKKREKESETIVIPEPVKLPAHHIALDGLKRLRKKELWKAGKTKEHQSQLTYLIRQYLENRFEINALESTTDQIIRALNKRQFDSKHEFDLKEILQIADMVKFAKATPPLDINEAFIDKAVDFVNHTKKELTPEEKEELNQNKKRYEDLISKLNKQVFFVISFGQFEFQHPWLLLLLLLLPLIWFLKKKFFRSDNVDVPFPHVGAMDDLISIKSITLKYLPILKYLGLAFLIIALARPRLVLKEEEVKAEGIDIMLVMDLSSSMLARDFNPDRLTASKEMAKRFIDKRPYDRIGLCVFAGESFTQSPLTTDHRIVKEFLSSIESGMLEDGTAIGMGLASAVNRLKTSESKSKIVILLTDGVNNAGYIKPMTAAEIAKEIKVKVYTIGVGSMGEAISPVSRRSDGRYVFGLSRVEIDEELLTEISELTGGRYFRATNEVGLEKIYSEIDTLEKTEIEVSVFKRYSEEFRKFLIIGLVLLLIEWVSKVSFLRTIP